MSENWRIGTDAFDYLSGQKRRVDIEKRRPAIKRASDLVGPGISSGAVRVSDWNNLLATFNGYYSSSVEEPADNAPGDDEAYVGITVMDSELGGTQTLTGIDTAVVWRRVFQRNPGDPDSIVFGTWVREPEAILWSTAQVPFDNSQMATLTFVSFSRPFPVGVVPVVIAQPVGNDPRVVWNVDQTTSGFPHLNFAIRAYYIPGVITTSVKFNWTASVRQ